MNLYNVLSNRFVGMSHYERLFAQKFGGSGEEIKELEGVPPLTFTANGQPLLDYLISGNTEQSGTPTPTTPIMPQGTGDKTANLWENSGFSAVAIGNNHNHVQSNSYGTTLSSTIGTETIITQSNYPTGNSNYQNGFFFIDVDFSKYNVGDVITLSFDYICNEIHSVGTQTNVYAGTPTNSLPVVLSSGSWNISGRLTVQITIITNMFPYVEVRLCGNSITVKNVMVNAGSTALPYEPYGNKIPISSGGVTTDVYLGEVETTRKIKKLVLSGKEVIQRYIFPDVTRFGVYVGDTTNIGGFCTHYEWILQSGGITDHFYTNNNGDVFIFSTTISTVEDFKTYLQQQYAAGTPVTVWYVLATEETAVVNEPLMKIGDYADSLTATQAGVEIPTIKGNNTLDIDTTIKPSNVYIKYKT